MLFSRDLMTGPATAVFPASWPVFAGHFEGRPVVPLWALLGFVVAVAEDAAGRPLEIEGVERVKLRRAVGADEPVTCVVTLEGRRASAQLSTASGEVGSALLSIRDGA